MRSSRLMALAGNCLVVATPERPAQVVLALGVLWRGQEQEQAAYLRHG